MAYDSEHPHLGEYRAGSSPDEFRTDTNGEPSDRGVDPQLVGVDAPASIDCAQTSASPLEPAVPPVASQTTKGSQRLGIASVLLAVILALLSGAFGGWAYDTYLKKPPAAPEPAVTAGEPAPASPGPAAISTDDVTPWAKQVDELASRLDRLQERVAAIPSPQPPSDLTAMRARIAALEKDYETYASIPSRLSALSERVAALDKELAVIRNEVATSGVSVRKTSGSSPGSVAVATLKESNPSTRASGLAPDSDLDRAVELFKQEKYREALYFFGKLEESNPADARVWYYAALANGLVTSQWRDATERLVQKGVECEHAGTPGREAIDSCFADLTENSGKEWLAYYRKRAASH